MEEQSQKKYKRGPIEYLQDLAKSAELEGVPKGLLTGKVALITGGGGGIGGAIAMICVHSGAKAVIADINKERCDAVASIIASRYGEESVISLYLDARDSKQVKGVFEKTVATFGKLDTLVCNAGVTVIRSIDEVTDEDIDHIYDTNLKGYTYCCREAARIMKPNRAGSIILISSKNGIIGAWNKALYCAAKGGELVLCRSLARELGPSKIRINVVCPDAVIEGSGIWEDEAWVTGTCKRYGLASRQDIPEYYRQRCALKESIYPSDIGKTALFVASDLSSKTTGQIFPVDGGFAFVR